METTTTVAIVQVPNQPPLPAHPNATTEMLLSLVYAQIKSPRDSDGEVELVLSKPPHIVIAWYPMDASFRATIALPLPRPGRFAMTFQELGGK